MVQLKLSPGHGQGLLTQVLFLSWHLSTLRYQGEISSGIMDTVRASLR